MKRLVQKEKQPGAVKHALEELAKAGLQRFDRCSDSFGPQPQPSQLEVATQVHLLPGQAASKVLRLLCDASF